ncbi:hypothetical protein H5U56_29645, partial [Escherichia coli]|nr:hypothetical protein [Escherichia coli]
YSLLATASP